MVCEYGAWVCCSASRTDPENSVAVKANKYNCARLGVVKQNGTVQTCSKISL